MAILGRPMAFGMEALEVIGRSEGLAGLQRGLAAVPRFRIASGRGLWMYA